MEAKSYLQYGSIGLGIAAVATTTPIILGFSTAGIVAGSVAAGMQSSIGSVAAGSIFASVQSLGATGLFSSVATYTGLGSIITGVSSYYIK